MHFHARTSTITLTHSHTRKLAQKTEMTIDLSPRVDIMLAKSFVIQLQRALRELNPVAAEPSLPPSRLVQPSSDNLLLM